MDDRTQEILSEAKAIALAIETEETLLPGIALRAKRLAHLLGESFAFEWLSLECAGSPGAWDQLATDATASQRATLKWIRVRTGLDIATFSLPQFTFRLKSRGIPADKLYFLTDSLEELYRHFYAVGTEVARLERAPIGQAQVALLEAELRQAIQRVGGAIHEWASGVYAAHRFRQFAGSIFDRLKTSSDGCPCPAVPWRHREAESCDRARGDRQPRGVVRRYHGLSSGASRFRRRGLSSSG